MPAAKLAKCFQTNESGFFQLHRGCIRWQAGIGCGGAAANRPIRARQRKSSFRFHGRPAIGATASPSMVKQSGSMEEACTKRREGKKVCRSGGSAAKVQKKTCGSTVFSTGHPRQYSLAPAMLVCADRTRRGRFIAVWPQMQVRQQNAFK